MGSAWTMYNCGNGGDTTVEIMFRQGCLKIKFDTDYTFTYPVKTDGLSGVILEDLPFVEGVPTSYFHLNKLNSWKYVNPCTINGIPCRVNQTSVTPLKECEDVPGDWITSDGATFSPNVDVNVYYIWANGGYVSTEQLVDQQKAMVAFGSEQYIVLGSHRPLSQMKSNKAIDDSYFSRMSDAFGDHFLNLNKEIRVRAAEITWRAGVYDSIVDYYGDAGIEDRMYVSQGKIPKSLFLDDLHHPNDYGCKAFAILIHDKMVKLGYLDDDYILSTGADL